MSTVKHTYSPDFVSPPGETLDELLDERGVTQAGLAERTGLAAKTINEIIKGKAPLSHETALLLERVLGVPAHFWNNRERQYREYLTEKKERERLEDHIDWLGMFPVKAMIALGWIAGSGDKVGQIRELLNYFAVASREQWSAIWLMEDSRAAFRRSLKFASEPGHTAAWLRYGEIAAGKRPHAVYDEKRFRAALSTIRSRTMSEPESFLPEMIELCAASGVAFVPTPELPRTRICGATRWLTPQLALIQISLRYKSDDHFWFTFFHEAAHVLLHGKREVFLEETEAVPEQKKEDEANRFAADLLIPPEEFNSLRGVKRYSRADVEAFAARIGIAPGIVVGRLQYEGMLPLSHLNALKHRFEWG